MNAQMKALTNSQIVAVYTANEAGVSKAQLSRDYGVNVKSINKAIEITAELRAKAQKRVAVAQVAVAKVEEKVLSRPTKKVTVVAKPKFKKPAQRQRVPVNSAMADALKAALGK